MAQQSARWGRKNQMYSSSLEHAFMIWFRSANSLRARSSIAASEAGQMATSDYVPIFFKNRLRLAGRPQMRHRLTREPCSLTGTRSKRRSPSKNKRYCETACRRGGYAALPDLRSFSMYFRGLFERERI